MKKPAFFRRLLPFLMVALSMIILLIYFKTANFKTVSNGTLQLLNETTTRKRTLLSEKFQSYKTLVSSLAFAYREELSSEDELFSSLSEIEANTGFDYIRFIDQSGMSHTAEGEEADCSDRSYFIRAMNGETGVSDVQNSRLNGESMIGFFSPVEKDGEIIGALVAFISQKSLSVLLKSELFGLKVDAFIISTDNLIVGSDDVSLLGQELNMVKEPYLEQEVIHYIRSEKSGVESLKSSLYKETEQSFIAKIGSEDYYLIMVFPVSSINTVAKEIGRSGDILFVCLLVVLIIYIIYSVAYIYLSNKKNRRMRSLIIGGIVDNDDAVLLLKNDGNVEVIKESKAFKGINAEVGSIVSLLSVVDVFTKRLKNNRDDFSVLFYSAITSARNKKGYTERFVSAFNCEGETMYLQFMFRSALEGKDPVVVITIRLVTDVVEKEQKERERIQEALEKAEAAAKAKSTFLANMSHDLRTPMNAILGYTNLALSNLNDPKKEKRYLERITDSSNQLLSLLNDILDMTLIEGGKISIEESPCSIRDVFASIESLTETMVAAKGQMLHISVHNLVHERVFVDKVRLNQILLNCVTNAIKYTPEGGDVWLSVSEKAGREEGKGEFVFSIRDNGIGMSKEFLSKIWEPFERERNTTVSKIQGTGLGMAITKNLVSMMGGEVEVESEEGKGSEFVVTLPLRIYTTSSMDITNVSGKKALVAGETKTIRSLPPILERLGFSVETAGNFAEAMDKTSGVSFLLLDMTIPRQSGMDCILKLRNKIGSNALFVVTTYKLETDERLEDYGVDAYAPKPVFMSDIQKILSHWPINEGKVFVTRKEMDLRGRRVLLVEDNDLNREIAQTVLENMGLLVECAVDGKEALDMVEKADSDHFDIVLMDIQMPKMDGYEATRRIRALSDRVKAEVPILSMTANAFPEDKTKALEAGMDGHVAKPLEVTVLVSEMIEAILSRD